MKAQIIEKDGQPEWAILPYEEYRSLLEQAEGVADAMDFDRAQANLAAGEELVPAGLVDRLLTGEPPLRVWREHRGLTQEALAAQVGITKSYLSQLEGGKRGGSLPVLRRLATALGVDLADLTAI